MPHRIQPEGTFDAATLLEEVADGLGVVDASGEILWMSARLAGQDPETLRKFADSARECLREPDGTRRLQSRRFRAGNRSFEAQVSRLGPAGDRALAILVNVSPRQRLLDRVEAVDAAGASLLDLDAIIVNPLNVAERLKLIEGRIEQGLRDLFGAANFEVRLLDRKSRVLELVIHRGIEPLPIGKQMKAEAEGHGITGWVASTGESVLCRDPQHDPRYMQGLPGCRCALTAPLLLHDRVVGTANLESGDPRAFEEEDRLLLELYGRYVAMALNILDMLIVERYTTNQRVSGSVREEIAVPVRSVRESLDAAKAAASGEALECLNRLEGHLTTLERRLKAASEGFRGVLGVDRVEGPTGEDNLLQGRRVLVVDDEAGIREAIATILGQHGAQVRLFDSATAAIEALQQAKSSSEPFELVLSDVRMPDRNGYEIFRAAKDADPDMPVILMTGFGYDPHHSIVRSSQEGLHCFLFKPFQAQQLLDEVRKALVPQAPAGD
ncbi:MAG: response regulator [Planctomycetes bacterium]|nr:response regulator [Planctomycetota bacterium]